MTPGAACETSVVVVTPGAACETSVVVVTRGATCETSVVVVTRGAACTAGAADQQIQWRAGRRAPPPLAAPTRGRYLGDISAMSRHLRCSLHPHEVARADVTGGERRDAQATWAVDDAPAVARRTDGVQLGGDEPAGVFV